MPIPSSLAVRPCAATRASRRSRQFVLNVARCQHGVSGMLVPHQGKIEDRHDGVSDRLVEEPVMRPDRVRAFIVECVEQA